MAISKADIFTFGKESRRKIAQQNFVYISHTKFHPNRSIGLDTVACGWTDGWMDGWMGECDETNRS
jgi:hypothetical protein